MELILCLFAAFLGQLFSILYNVRDYLKTNTFNWTTWRNRNLPETIVSLLLAMIVAYFLYITDFRLLTNALGLDLSELGKTAHCFIAGMLLDTVTNLISKIGIRKSSKQ